MITRTGARAKFDRLYSNAMMHLAKGDLLLAEKYLSAAIVQLKAYYREAPSDELEEIKEWLLELCSHAKDIKRYRTAQPQHSDAGAGLAGEGSFLFPKEDVTSVSFDDVVGLDAVKGQIYDMIIFPQQYGELYDRFRKKRGGGILLYGPPGNGKTMIARAIAHETSSAFFPIKFSDLGSKWFGETEGRIRSLFDQARSEESAVIFFDEIDAIASKRTDGSAMDRVVAELLTQLDGINRKGGSLTVLAATNKPQNLDPAILRPGRFDEKIYIPLPDLNARRAMFEKRLSGIPSSINDYSDIALRSEGFSGAEIERACEKAKQSVIRSIIGGAPSSSLVSAREVISAINDMRSV